jgi:hypothetical protein
MPARMPRRPVFRDVARSGTRRAFLPRPARVPRGDDDSPAVTSRRVGHLKTSCCPPRGAQNRPRPAMSSTGARPCSRRQAPGTGRPRVPPRLLHLPLPYPNSPTAPSPLHRVPPQVHRPRRPPGLAAGATCDRTSQNNSVLSPKPVHMTINQ